MKMFKILMTVATGTVLALGSASANAGTITQTVSLLSPEFAVVTAGSTSFSQFDGALGTLNSVTFNYSLPDGVVYLATNHDYMFYYLFNPNFTTQLLKGTNFGINGGANLGPPSVSSYSDPFLAQYVGLGTLTLKANVSKSYGSDRVHINGTPFAVITYNFTDAVASVPEPATWAMMILGFGGVGFTARRRKNMARLSAA